LYFTEIAMPAFKTIALETVHEEKKSMLAIKQAVKIMKIENENRKQTRTTYLEESRTQSPPFTQKCLLSEQKSVAGY